MFQVINRVLTGVFVGDGESVRHTQKKKNTSSSSCCGVFINAINNSQAIFDSHGNMGQSASLSQLMLMLVMHVFVSKFC